MPNQSHQNQVCAAAPAPKGADPRLSGTGRRFNLTVALLAGALTASLFGSRILLQEVDSRPDMPFYPILRKAASAWDTAMRQSAAALPGRMLHDAIRAAEAARLGIIQADRKALLF